MHYPLWFPYSLPKLLEAVHLLKAQIPQTERGISSLSDCGVDPFTAKSLTCVVITYCHCYLYLEKL